MHPLLKSPKTILLLFLLWLPFVASACGLQSIVTGQSFLNATILIAPPMFLELFILLSSWYVCRATPLDSKKTIIIILTHLLASGLMILIWMQVTMMYSEILVLIRDNENWRGYFNQSYPFLFAQGILFYFLAAAIHYLVLELEKTRKAEQRALENSLAVAQAQLNSLKATVHPHFLFNSLTALGALTATDPAKAQKMSAQLAEFLRYSMEYGKQEWVTIDDEIEHIKNYSAIEQTRLGSRLKIEYDIDANVSGSRVLPFTLIPLIENGVKHGIEPSVVGGSLSLTARKSGQSLFIRVTNPFDPKSKSRKGEGFGLDALRRRLAAGYGKPLPLVVDNNGKQYSVTLKIPA